MKRSRKVRRRSRRATRRSRRHTRRSRRHTFCMNSLTQSSKLLSTALVGVPLAAGLLVNALKRGPEPNRLLNAKTAVRPYSLKHTVKDNAGGIGYITRTAEIADKLILSLVQVEENSDPGDDNVGGTLAFIMSEASRLRWLAKSLWTPDQEISNLPLMLSQGTVSMIEDVTNYELLPFLTPSERLVLHDAHAVATNRTITDKVLAEWSEELLKDERRVHLMLKAMKQFGSTEIGLESRRMCERVRGLRRGSLAFMQCLILAMDHALQHVEPALMDAVLANYYKSFTSAGEGGRRDYAAFRRLNMRLAGSALREAGGSEEILKLALSRANDDVAISFREYIGEVGNIAKSNSAFSQHFIVDKNVSDVELFVLLDEIRHLFEGEDPASGFSFYNAVSELWDAVESPLLHELAWA